MKFLVILIAISTQALASQYKPNELIVRYKDGAARSFEAMQDLYSGANVVSVKRFQAIDVKLEHLILAEGTDLEKTMALLRARQDVAYVQPNYILHALPTQKIKPVTYSTSIFGGLSILDGDRPAIAPRPDEVSPPQADPDMDQAYGITKVGADKAWNNKILGSQKITVAVIDTGIDYNHKDLAFNMWRNPDPKAKDIVGFDFIHNDELPFDDNEHGTHCAGVIGAVGGNGVGISGVNQRVSLMAVKFLSGEGSGETTDAIKAIDYAVAHGAKVLSNSWGGGGDDPGNDALNEAIGRAEKAGVLFVAASGNDSADADKNPDYPAAFNQPNIISVAATDSSDRMAFFSNYGKKSVHLAAPGVDVYSTVPGDSYDTLSGTSMACPHVAGAAALVWSTNPSLTYAQVRNALLQGVDKIPSLDGKMTSGGRLNVEKAIAAAHSSN